MKVRFTPVAIVLFSLLSLVGCKKDDPAPLESEVKGKLLAGEKDASKNWRLLGVTVATASNPAQALNFPACFLDNVYTFNNNASQDYQSADGAAKCSSTDTDPIEKGNWSFTADGLIVNILVDETNTQWGLFSSEILVFGDADGNITDILLEGFPYPASVVSLTESNMTLEMNRVDLSKIKYKYTLTFTAI